MAETHDTADNETSDPPAGTGRGTAVQVEPASSSAIGIVPPPRARELAPTGSYEPTETQDVVDVHATAGEVSKVPGGPGLTAGKFVASQDDGAVVAAEAAPQTTPTRSRTMVTTMRKTPVTTGRYADRSSM
jgi:hypothetical protein